MTASEPELAAHRATCPDCAELSRDEAGLGHALGASSRQQTLEAEELWTLVQRDIRRDTGVRAWLRSRKSRLRVAFAGSAALLVAACGALHARPDWAAYPVAQGLFWILILGVLVTASLCQFFAPPGRASPNPARRVGLALAGLVLPFGMALTPAPQGQAAALTGAGADFAAGALACFGFGVLLAVPLAVVLWALRRSERASLEELLLAAAGTGLAANLALFMHCPSTHPEHLAAGHGTLGMALLVFFTAARRAA